LQLQERGDEQRGGWRSDNCARVLEDTRMIVSLQV
jgi:hypothetical protein